MKKREKKERRWNGVYSRSELPVILGEQEQETLQPWRPSTGRQVRGEKSGLERGRVQPWEQC